MGASEKAVAAARRAHHEHEYVVVPSGGTSENATCLCGFDFMAAGVTYWDHRHEAIADAAVDTDRTSIQAQIEALAAEYDERSSDTEDSNRYPWGVAADDLRALTARIEAQP